MSKRRAPELNPYSPALFHETNYASRHLWRGREITVCGGARPSHLWLIIGYSITIDGRETFSTAQAAPTEDFRWTFIHQGKLVNGHFTTFGTQNGFRRKYNLSIDGDALGPGEVQLTGWWGIWVVWPLSLLSIGTVIYWTLLK